MKRIASILLALLLLLTTAALGAEAGEEYVNYIKDVFNETKGLPTSEANTIIQAPDGYLWIGSYGGLIRYDGSTMVEYSDKLENHAIRALFRGLDEAVYIGTNGACAYRLQGDEFTHLETEDGRSFLTVRGFAQGKGGSVFLASPSGIARIDGDRVVPFTYPELEGSNFLSVAVDGNGSVWAMSDGGELFVMNDKKFLARYTSEDFFAGESIYALCSDPDGVLYIGSNGSRVVKLAVPSAPAADYDDLSAFDRWEYDTGVLSTLNNLTPASDGSILVSANNGFGYLDGQGRFHLVEYDPLNSYSGNWAALDNEGNRWVATSNYGVIRYSVGCYDSCNFNSDLESYTVNAVARQGDYFYLGTDGGLMVFDRDWRQVDLPVVQTLEGVRIRNVTVDTLGRVWMATYSSHGAYCYDPETGTGTDFGAAEGLNSEKVRVVYPLSDGRMLVGNQLGVNIIEDGKITASYGAEDGMETTSVLCAMELNGRIYVGTDGSGIYEITDTGLRNLHYDAGLTGGVILRMEPDAEGNGNYFVCAGELLFYCENDTFRVLDGMETESGSIFSMYDVGGRLWVLQNGGIASADKAAVLAGEKTYTAHYGLKCGMTGTLSANTWNWLEEGGLFMPTRSGVSVFHFQGPQIQLPRAILNSVTVDGEHFEHPQGLTLPPDAKRVTIDIATLLFSDTTEFQLAYQLEGFDTVESYTMDKHVSVSYTNLPGGTYTLKLRVIDPLTGESCVEQTTTFVKQKKITEHAWFYAACLVLAAAVIAALVWLFIRRKTMELKKKQEEQRHYIDEITKVFSSCVDMRDHYTNGHSARVAKYTAWLAEKLGKSKDEVDRMYHIALLHDVGKISIPDAVLNKPERLTDEEYALMRSHAERGYEVLKGMDIDQDMALGAGYHHERYDGKGYPRGLKGEEIPEVARIIGVADTFDAMYSTRPYRKRMELSTVVSEIQRCSGTQFSPEVVEAFMALYREGAFDNE
jgi:energy-coupling factor transport system substrate-specific component